MKKRLENLLNDTYDESFTIEECESYSELMHDDHEYKIYKNGYVDGLKAAIMIATENDSTNSYTIEMDDIFSDENEEIHGAED